MKAEQLCVDTICYRAFPLERALSGIAEAGISRVELCASVRDCNHAAPERLGPGASSKLQRLLETHGLTAVSYSGHADLTTETGLIAFTSRLQLAADLNIPIVNTPAQIPPERWDHETRDRFSRNIVDLADLAAKLEVALCLETLGIPMGTIEECAALLQRLDHPALRINYDPAALLVNVEGARPGRGDITLLAPYLGHVHLNDKASMEAGRSDLRPIGQGTVDWEPILGELGRVGFAGPASIEIGWEVAPESPEVVDQAVRRSIQFVRPYFSEN